MPPKKPAAAATKKPAATKKATDVPANRLAIAATLDICTIVMSDDDVDPTDELRLPKLYSKTTTGAIRSWQMCIGIPATDIEKDRVASYKEAAYYYTISGQIKDATGQPASASKPFAVVTSERTKVAEGKNIGRSNETSPLQQAILEARGIYDKKCNKEGYVLREGELLDRHKPVAFSDLCAATNRGPAPWRVGPAAAHNYDKFEKKLPETYEIQPKLDGAMAVAVFVPAHVSASAASSATTGTGCGIVDLWCRGTKEHIAQPHIADALKQYLEPHPGIYIVGELWLPGHSLQEISGAARRAEDAKPLHMYIFDCFDISRPNLQRSDRVQLLKTIFANIAISDQEAAYAALLDPESPGPLHLIPSWTCGTRDAGTVLYKRFLADKLEGAMLRDLHGIHEYDFNAEVRSYSILKRKPVQDAEWPVHDWFCGVGKEADLVSWTCRNAGAAAAAASPPKTFNTSMNLPNEARRNIAAAFKADPATFEKFRGQLLTIKYSAINADTGFPQQPKALYFRDPKVQAELQKLFG